MRRFWVLCGINLGFALLVGLVEPRFLSGSNLAVVAGNATAELLALGPLALLLIGGFLDLSLDGTAALSGVLAGTLMMRGVAWPSALLVGLTCGCMIGVLNGWSISYLRLNPLIVTLATWWLSQGLAYGITQATTPFGFPPSFQAFGQAGLFGIRLSVFVALAMVLGFEFWLQRTRFGAHVFVTGDNPLAGRMMGVSGGRVTRVLYLVAGLSASLIGLVTASRLNGSSVNAVDGLTLRVIAAAVIGGCSLAGGQGNIVNGLLGLLFMDLMVNAATMLGISPYWQKAIIGGVLLIAVLVDRVGSQSWLRVAWRPNFLRGGRWPQRRPR